MKAGENLVIFRQSRKRRVGQLRVNRVHPVSDGESGEQVTEKVRKIQVRYDLLMSCRRRERNSFNSSEKERERERERECLQGNHFRGNLESSIVAMAPPASIRWFAAASALMLCLLISPSTAIYCDEDDCYDLLGVTQSANSSEIKKAYYKLSLKHHPDKNPDPESKKLFVKIANAYEILKDEASREQYDYAIAHPEEYFYNTARYYQAYYGHKTDPRAVLVGFLLVLSAFQYFNQWTRYNQAIDMVKKTPAYKNRLRQLELERSGGTTTKKKSNKQTNKKMDEDLSKELELQITGAEQPSMWDLLGVRFILLPYTIGKLLLWHGCWFWRYKVKQAPYTWDDASYLTQRSLSAPLDAWRNVDDLRKEDLINRRLWEGSNLESYYAEMRKESKRRR